MDTVERNGKDNNTAIEGVVVLGSFVDCGIGSTVKEAIQDGNTAIEGVAVLEGLAGCNLFFLLKDDHEESSTIIAVAAGSSSSSSVYKHGDLNYAYDDSIVLSCINLIHDVNCKKQLIGHS